MISNAVVDRYVKALFETAQEHHLTEKIDGELALLGKELESVSGFFSLLTGHAITGNEKKRLLTEAFASFEPFTQNFLCIVVDKEREAFLPDMINHFHDLYVESQGIVRASLTTARPLAEQDYQEIAATVGAEWGKTVEFTCDTDPALLGGAVIQVEDKVIDVSLSKQFQLIREQLLK